LLHTYIRRPSDRGADSMARSRRGAEHAKPSKRRKTLRHAVAVVLILVSAIILLLTAVHARINIGGLCPNQLYRFDVTVLGDLEVKITYASRPFTLIVPLLGDLKAFENATSGSRFYIAGAAVDLGLLAQTVAVVDDAELPFTGLIPLSTFRRRLVYSWPLLSASIDVCVYPETIRLNISSFRTIYKVEAVLGARRASAPCSNGVCVLNVSDLKSPDIELEYYYMCGPIAIAAKFGSAYVDLYENRLIMVSAAAALMAVAAAMYFLDRGAFRRIRV